MRHSSKLILNTVCTVTCGRTRFVTTFGRENLFFNFTNYLLELGAATRCRRLAVRSVLLRLKYLRRVSESVFDACGTECFGIYKTVFGCTVAKFGFRTVLFNTLYRVCKNNSCGCDSLHPSADNQLVLIKSRDSK